MIDRTYFENRSSKQTGETFAGLEFDEDGSCITLFTLPGTSTETISKAMRQAEIKLGRVEFSCCEIDPTWLEPVHKVCECPSCSKGWIDAARWIVANGQFRRLLPSGELVPEDKRGGKMLDLFSACALVKVYEALNPEHQAKFNSLPWHKAAVMAFQLLS